MNHTRLSEVQRDRYSQLIADFARLSVLVVGDCFLDDWMYGRPERLCREAPIPVMDVTHHRYFGGGAANAATNLAALGAACCLISVTGTDRDSCVLLRVLEEAGVDCQFVSLPQRGTVAKRRLVADRQIMLRLDEGDTAETSNAVSDQLLARLDAAVAGVDVVVICDYGSGTCTDRFIAGVAARRDRLPQLVVDAHEPARWNGVHADLMTPSFAEVAQLLPAPASESDRAQVVEANSAELRSRLGAKVVAVTLDSDGAVVSAPDQPCYRSYTTPVAAPATIGAGDCYTAAFALALASGGSVADSAELAQLTAAVAIGGRGTSACSAVSLLAELAVPD
ncbi:MAG: bifunctional heptose 7-phosphate kinase/heptose 1-phosphate adenyltransferase, partial [Mycobacteriales bacterium]